jgi:hypothetical protein
LPIHNYRLADVIDVRLTSLEQLSCPLAYLLEEVFVINPITDSIHIIYMFALSFIQDCVDVCFRVRNSLGSDDGFKHLISLALALIVDDTWAINQVNTLGERNILPDFGLSWDGSNFTYSFSL